MNTVPLSSTYQQDASLRFTSSNGCKRWIESLPLTNIQQAQHALTVQLRSLSDAQLPALERLQILETLKEASIFVQAESSKRYSGKPLPLEAGEAAAWSNGIALWQEMGSNYRQCLRAYREGDLSIAPHAALVCMRCLGYLGSEITDYYRIYRQVPGTMWRTLHELYSFAEQHGFARIRVQDSFAHCDPDSSCAETYIQALLMYLAHPFALSVRQMGFVKRWLEKWATLVSLTTQPLPPSPIPLLAVDLGGASDTAFVNDPEPQPNLRYLDLEQLSKTLRQAINLLKQGQTPGQLGLGDDARQPGCENLLMLIYVQWCRAGILHGEDRREIDMGASVCFGIQAIHCQLNGGHAFRQPGDLTSREKQDLDTYGYIARVAHATGGGEDSLETCQIINQSASGFVCLQRKPDAQARITHNQLFAVRRSGSKHFHIGMVQWLRTNENDELYCGVRLFPGTPQAVAVRASNVNPASNSRYEPALFLPEVSSPVTPATLILPAGRIQSGRFVEVFSNDKRVATLLNLLEKGGDFDRGTITVV
jgi:hypothetical protein